MKGLSTMPVSNYPNGFANGITVRGMPLLNTYPGNVFWVHSGTGSDGGKGTFDRPYSTIDYAIGRCTASKGDIIVVKAGHTETISAASGIALDVIGVAVIGMGTGTLRPTINFTATASTLTMSAASCTLYNILLTGGIDAVVSPVVVSASDCAIINCEYRDVTGQCTDGILTTAGADRLLIDGLRYDGAVAAGTNAGIAIVGGDGIVIRNLRMDGNFAVGGIDIRTTATTDLEVSEVKFRTRNAADIFLKDTITASTGFVGPNLFLQLQDNAANITEAITGATFVQFAPIMVVNLAGEIGMAINTTASTDA
jgi:hypothetical protein